MNKIQSVDTLEEALDGGILQASEESLRVLAQFWSKSPRLDEKIESFLVEQDLVEEFREMAGIAKRKKSSEILPSESLELSEKTKKAQQMLGYSLDVEVVLKKGSLNSYEEVEYETTSFISGSVKKVIGLGLAAMLLGPMVQSNLQQMSFAAISPTVTKNWQIVPEAKYKDPILKDNINEVLSELSNFNDPAIDDVAQKIIGLNLEDVGEESEEDFEELATIERNATIDKIKRLINSYYHREVPNAYTLAEKIYDASKEKTLDYHILLGIIKTESDFRQDAISSTGDVSLVQINYRIWSREFIRIKTHKLSQEDAIKFINVRADIAKGKEVSEEDRGFFNYISKIKKDEASFEKINEKIIAQLEIKTEDENGKKKLKPVVLNDEERSFYDSKVKELGCLNYFELIKDPYYSIDKMAEILKVLTERHNGDKNWFARYHSSSLDNKAVYANKVRSNIRHMDKVNVLYLQEQIGVLKEDLKKLASSHGIDQEKISKLTGYLEKFVTKDTDRTVVAKN